MSDMPIGVGLVGLGTIGRRHAGVLARLDGAARLVAASGGRPEDLIESGHPTARHLPPDDVIHHPDVELVAICSPSGLHGVQALAALRAGKHVVVEKPLSVDVDTAEEIVRTAQRLGRFVSVICQRRLQPQNQRLRRMLRDGVLGRPLLGEAFVHWYRDDAYYDHATWRTLQDQGGGSLMNQGLHSVDLLAWLLGPVTHVSAQYASLGHDIDAEDTTVATLRFASGALGVVATSTATPPGEPATLAVFTSAGSVQLENDRVSRWEFDQIPAPSSSPGATGADAHLAQWRDIVDAYRTGRRAAVSAEDGLDTVRVLCAIYDAGASGRTVTLPSSPAGSS